MVFNLGTVDWNTVSAVATLAAVLVALFYQPFLNRRQLVVAANLRTNPDQKHWLELSVVNRGASPVWITSAGVLFDLNGERIFSVVGSGQLPKQLSPSEPLAFSSDPMTINLRFIYKMYVVDSYNKFWYIKGEKLRKMKENIAICIQDNGSIEKGVVALRRPTLKKKPKNA